MAKLDGAGARAVLVFAVVLVVAGSVAGIIGLRSGGGKAPYKSVASKVSCARTVDRPGPQLDLGVQPSQGPGRKPVSAAEVRELVAKAKAAGASVISTAADWAYLQPEKMAHYDWHQIDEVIDDARAAGLQVRLQIQGMPRWAVDTSAGAYGEWRPPLTAAELHRWSDFVTVLTHHVAGRVKYVEVWTEPDEAKTWTTGPDATAFARLLHTTYARIKAVDPTIKVISGGLSGNDLGYLQALYEARSTLYGPSTKIFDMVGLHPYSGSRSPLINSPTFAVEKQPFGEVDQNFLGFRRVHAQMAAAGDTATPLYLSEFGYDTVAHDGQPAVPDDLRASYAREALSAATCYPYVTALSWYYLHPTHWDPASWTLLDADLKPDATYDALKAWAAKKPTAAATTGS